MKNKVIAASLALGLLFAAGIFVALSGEAAPAPSPLDIPGLTQEQFMFISQVYEEGDIPGTIPIVTQPPPYTYPQGLADGTVQLPPYFYKGSLTQEDLEVLAKFYEGRSPAYNPMAVKFGEDRPSALERSQVQSGPYSNRK